MSDPLTYLSQLTQSAAASFVGAADKVLDNPLINPMGAMIDTICSGIGVPQAVTDVAKVAVGAATGNPVLIANGATGLVAELASNPPAVTELFGGSVKAGADHCAGYVEVHGKPGVPAGAEAKVAPDQQLRPGLYARDNAHAFFGVLCGPLHHHHDHHVGHDPVRTRPPGGQYNPNSPLDPKITDYRHAVDVLEANFATFDTASGRRDGLFTRADLAKVANNPHASDQLRDAARFLLDNPEYYNRLELAANIGGKDGIIGIADLRSEKARVDHDIEKYGVPPPEGHDRGGDERVGGPGRKPSAGGESELSKILNDPNMSIEEKIMMILEKILDQTDEELLETTQQLDKANADRAKQSQGGKGDSTKADSAQEKLQLKLQQLMEKRKKMFELMSNFSMKFNEMAKTAIQNMARA